MVDKQPLVATVSAAQIDGLSVAELKEILAVVPDKATIEMSVQHGATPNEPSQYGVTFEWEMAAVDHTEENRAALEQEINDPKLRIRSGVPTERMSVAEVAEARRRSTPSNT